MGGWRGRNDSIVQDKEAQVDMSGRFGIFCASDGRGAAAGTGGRPTQERSKEH